MKNDRKRGYGVILSAVFLFCMLSGVSCMAQAAEKTPKLVSTISVAVLDFQVSGSKLAEMGPQVAILLNTQLSAFDEVILVERQELEKLLSEQELGASGTVTSDAAAKIGALTGAKILVTGRVFETGTQETGIKLYLVAKIMGTETSRVYGEQVIVSGSSPLEDAVSNLSRKIRTVVREKSGNLLAKPETKEDMLAKLKTRIAGKKLPAVTVNIKEVHFGQPVVDPAVETEFMAVLNQLGFPVIDPVKSGKQPDIIISGDGFSEYGIRKGNLYSCKGRVEIKATKADSGDLIMADRQTEVAVDLSERIAGKNALQKAAAKLIERVVPKLIAE